MSQTNKKFTKKKSKDRSPLYRFLLKASATSAILFFFGRRLRIINERIVSRRLRANPEKLPVRRLFFPKWHKEQIIFTHLTKEKYLEALHGRMDLVFLSAAATATGINCLLLLVIVATGAYCLDVYAFEEFKLKYCRKEYELNEKDKIWDEKAKKVNNFKDIIDFVEEIQNNK